MASGRERTVTIVKSQECKRVFGAYSCNPGNNNLSGGSKNPHNAEIFIFSLRDGDFFEKLRYP